MPINRKSKIIIASLAFLIVGVLIFWKTDEGISVWDILNPRPGPISITPYRTHGTPLPITSGIPTPSPDYLGLLPWTVRLASKEMPYVEGVVWKTYTNKEYGFEMQYPEGWEIGTDLGSDNPNVGVDQIIFFSFVPSNAGYDRLHLTLLHHSNRGLMEYLKRYYKEFRGDNFKPIIKTIVINNINWFLDDPHARDMQSDMYAEKNDYIYHFGGTSFSTRNERNIIEYMIKSFRFID